MTRDDKGRFVKGGSPGPGRPPKATEQEYQDVVLEVIPIERWRRIVEAQAKRAERGDIQAFSALAKYLAPVIEHKDVTSGGQKIVVTLKSDD